MVEENQDQDQGKGGESTVVLSTAIPKDNLLKADVQEAGRFLTVSELAKVDRGSAAATQYFLDSRRTILEGFLQNDPSPLVRHEAAFALGCIGSHSNIFALRNALASDTSPLVRHEAALALSEIGDSCAIPYLREGLRDENHEVSISCRIALARLEQPSSQKLAPTQVVEKLQRRSLSVVSKDQDQGGDAGLEHSTVVESGEAPTVGLSADWIVCGMDEAFPRRVSLTFATSNDAYAYYVALKKDAEVNETLRRAGIKPSTLTNEFIDQMGKELCAVTSERDSLQEQLDRLIEGYADKARSL